MMLKGSDGSEAVFPQTLARSPDPHSFAAILPPSRPLVSLGGLGRNLHPAGLTWSQSAAITEEMDLQHIPLYLGTLQIWPLPLSAPPEEGFLVKFLYDEEPWELVVGPRKAVLRRMGHTRGFSVKNPSVWYGFLEQAKQ